MVHISSIKRHGRYFKLAEDGVAHIRLITYVPCKAGEKKTKVEKEFRFQRYTYDPKRPDTGLRVGRSECCSQETMRSWLEHAEVYHGTASVVRLMVRKAPEKLAVPQPLEMAVA